MFTKIMYLTITVSDQDKALDFYTDLGFEKRIDHAGPDGRFLTISLKGHDVEIILWRDKSIVAKLDQAMPVNDSPGILFIETKDLRKEYDELVKKGIQFIEPQPVDYPYGVRITAVDPDGNRIALRQRK